MGVQTVTVEIAKEVSEVLEVPSAKFFYVDLSNIIFSNAIFSEANFFNPNLFSIPFSKKINYRGDL